MEAQSGSTAVSGGRIRASSAPSKRSSRKNTREIDEKVAENGAFFECRTRQFALFRADCTQLQHASLPALTFAECACLGRSLDRQICTGAPFFAGRGTKQHMYDLIDLPIAPILSRDWSVPRVLNHCDRSLVRQAHRSRVRLGWKRGPRTVRSSPGRFSWPVRASRMQQTPALVAQSVARVHRAKSCRTNSVLRAQPGGA
jgi:hypothetical protein